MLSQFKNGEERIKTSNMLKRIIYSLEQGYTPMQLLDMVATDYDQLNSEQKDVVYRLTVKFNYAGQGHEIFLNLHTEKDAEVMGSFIENTMSKKLNTNIVVIGEKLKVRTVFDAADQVAKLFAAIISKSEITKPFGEN